MNRTAIVSIILILLAGNIFLIFQYVDIQQQLKVAQNDLLSKTTSGNIIAFTQLFVSKVLKAEGEIDFETRLQLENAVRGLGDQEILTQWQKFIESENELGAQQEVKNLLEVLMNKVSTS